MNAFPLLGFWKLHPDLNVVNLRFSVPFKYCKRSDTPQLECSAEAWHLLAFWTWTPTIFLKYFCLCVYVYSMHSCTHIHMFVVLMHVEVWSWYQVSESLEQSSFYLLRRDISLNPELTIPASLTSQLALVFPSLLPKRWDYRGSSDPSNFFVHFGDKLWPPCLQAKCFIYLTISPAFFFVWNNFFIN